MGGTEGWQGPGKITKSSEHSWEMSVQFVVLLRDRLYLSHTLSQTHTCTHTHLRQWCGWEQRTVWQRDDLKTSWQVWSAVCRHVSSNVYVSVCLCTHWHIHLWVIWVCIYPEELYVVPTAVPCFKRLIWTLTDKSLAKVIHFLKKPWWKLKWVMGVKESCPKRLLSFILNNKLVDFQNWWMLGNMIDTHGLIFSTEPLNN